MERGAIAVKTPTDVLEILAKSNIFHAASEEKTKQLTLSDFMESQETPETDIKWNWSEMITIGR